MEEEEPPPENAVFAFSAALFRTILRTARRGKEVSMSKGKARCKMAKKVAAQNRGARLIGRLAGRPDALAMRTQWKSMGNGKASRAAFICSALHFAVVSQMHLLVHEYLIKSCPTRAGLELF